jgi:ribonucleoside-diphosphate reductase beta chain
MAGIFEERIAYKPFEYPEYDLNAWLPQSQAHWLHTEIPMGSDVKDWNENLTHAEKNLVGNILLGFAQTECAVSDYWTGLVTRWFPKYEIKEMAIAFGYFETIHAKAYSYLNETLGLTDFEAFLHEPTIANKFEMLTETKNEYTHKDLLKSAHARRDVARSLAIFSAFAEGVSLYSSFAVLYSFQLRNLLKGIGQQMKWSVRDESLHSKMGCRLFRHMCEEYPELKDQVQNEVEEAARLMVEMELKFIDKMFEMGDLENLKSEELKSFILRRANEKLNELGYEGIFEYSLELAEKLDWFYHLTGGVTHTDFFSVRPTDYAKQGAEEDWEDIF